MATKDWKKIGKKYGYEMIWENKNTKERIGLLDDYLNITTSKYQWVIVDAEINVIDSFNSRTQALSFAKQYMRTH